MPNRRSEREMISVPTRRLVDLRDTLVALAGLLEAVRHVNQIRGEWQYGSIKHAEKQLSRDAVMLSEWIEGFEQGELPF